MWKIHRYYLKEVLASSVMTFLVLFGIVMISLVYRGIERAAGFPLITAAKVTLYWAADAIPHVLAMSFLFSVVLSFARASQDREITALRSAGLSPRVAMSSALLVGMLFSLIGSYALHRWIPWAHFNKYHVVADGIQQVIQNTGMTDDKITLPGLVITWERIEERKWQDVYVFAKRSSKRDGPLSLGGVFRAKQAWISTQEEGSNSMLVLNFEDLHQPITGATTGGDGLISIVIDMQELSIAGQRHEGDKDISSEQLISEVSRGVHDNPVNAWYNVHRRSCFALMPLLFAPIGFCIGVWSRDRGRVMALVFGMAPLFLFYLGDFLGAKMVRSTDEPLFAWLPAAVVGVIGVPFCWRLLRY